MPASTYAPQLRKDQGEIPWASPAEVVLRHIRAMQPWPGSFTTLERPGHEPLRLSVVAAEPAVDGVDAGPPGLLMPCDEGLVVRTGTSPIRLTRLKPAGKREMSAVDFLRGNPLPEGTRLVAGGAG